jgi:hypothetical protein
LGNFLIKEVAKALGSELPQLRTFATLSPLPQFMPWLETQRPKTDEEESLVNSTELAVLRDVLQQRTGSHDPNTTPVGTVLGALDVDNWFEDPDLVRALKPIVMKLGAKYIYHEKKRAKAFCPVANFHIRNGAIFERINWLADVTKKVRARSSQPWRCLSVRVMLKLCVVVSPFRDWRRVLG